MKKIKARVTLQFEITINDENLQLVSDDAGEQEYIERQQRLFQAILSDPERLTAFLRYQVASDMGAYSWQDWDELILGHEDSDGSQALASSIATLSQTDQDFFREVQKDELFTENTEDVFTCFSTGLQDAKFEVVEDER